MKIVKVSADFSTAGPGLIWTSAAGGRGEAVSGQYVNRGQGSTGLSF